jgi:hypothetical protein
LTNGADTLDLALEGPRGAVAAGSSVFLFTLDPARGLIAGAQQDFPVELEDGLLVARPYGAR